MGGMSMMGGGMGMMGMSGMGMMGMGGMNMMGMGMGGMNMMGGGMGMMGMGGMNMMGMGMGGMNMMGMGGMNMMGMGMGGMNMMGMMGGGMGMMGMGMGGMGMMGMGGMNMMGMGMMGCHPGCFPTGTLVLTPSEPRKIETIRAGDYVLGVDTKGKAGPAKVHSAFVTENYLVEIETDSGRLTTTNKQPLCLNCGCCKVAGELKPGDELIRWENGKPRPTKVRAVQPTGRLAKVFNLVLEDQDFYIAGGFQVRSKPPLPPEATVSASGTCDGLPYEPIGKPK
jgi:hypothetical protein